MRLVEERKQVRIFVTDAAKKTISDYSEMTDMSEQGIMSRLVEWFRQQKQPVRDAVMGFGGDAINVNAVKKSFRPLHAWWLRVELEGEQASAKRPASPDGTPSPGRNQTAPGSRPDQRKIARSENETYTSDRWVGLFANRTTLKRLRPMLIDFGSTNPPWWREGDG